MKKFMIIVAFIFLLGLTTPILVGLLRGDGIDQLSTEDRDEAREGLEIVRQDAGPLVLNFRVVEVGTLSEMDCECPEPDASLRAAKIRTFTFFNVPAGEWFAGVGILKAVPD